VGLSNYMALHLQFLTINDVQEYLLPVYLFTGECLDADGKVIGEFEAYCEALLK
jgi:hypothetical protein